MRFALEYRAAAVELVPESDRTVADVARSLSIGPDDIWELDEERQGIRSSEERTGLM